MKFISLIALLGLSLTAYSQLKSGAITYQSTVTNNSNQVKKTPFEDDFETPPDYTYHSTTQFNENYFLSKTELERNNYTVLINRKTSSVSYSMADDYSKTIEFFDLSKSMEEIEKMSESIENYGYEEESMEYNNESGYHEDFYRELLSMPPRDTVVIQTTETREILGYHCKKVIIKIKGEIIQTVWYAEELSGLSDLFKIHKSIKGLALLVEMKTPAYTIVSEVTEISTTDGLKEIEAFSLPAGYDLDLGTIYVSDGEEDESSYDFSSSPDFVSFDGRKEFIKQVAAELEKTIKEVRSKKDNYYYYSIDFQISIDEQGKISDITYEADANDIPEKKMEALILRLKKNVKVQPAALYGKPVTGKLELNYSNSGTEMGPEQYYDEE